ncbi:competence type IV pilus minor pilin ComGE [Bacillus songklensis]|uniref:Competence type IV pilus minor pilin ComGE n=1 Tax=Bacillus songklensis TaxID=1069116 RepID=A0ABV8B164_9BACI
MLKSCRGYTLLEMLVAFSILFLLLAHILPLYIQIKQERKDIDIDKAAVKLLHEKVLEYKYDGASPSPSRRLLNGIVYEVSWQVEEQSLFKVCIYWENLSKQSKKRCDYIKR